MPSNASPWSCRKFLASAGATAAGSALVGFTSMQTGSYNAGNAWVEQGPKSYTVSGSTIVVKLAKNECVRVVIS